WFGRRRLGLGLRVELDPEQGELPRREVLRRGLRLGSGRRRGRRPGRCGGGRGARGGGPGGGGREARGRGPRPPRGGAGGRGRGGWGGGGGGSGAVPPSALPPPSKTPASPPSSPAPTLSPIFASSRRVAHKRCLIPTAPPSPAARNAAASAMFLMFPPASLNCF